MHFVIICVYVCVGVCVYIYVCKCDNRIGVCARLMLCLHTCACVWMYSPCVCNDLYVWCCDSKAIHRCANHRNWFYTSPILISVYPGVKLTCFFDIEWGGTLRRQKQKLKCAFKKNIWSNQIVTKCIVLIKWPFGIRLSVDLNSNCVEGVSFYWIKV